MRSFTICVLTLFVMASCQKNTNGPTEPIPHNKALVWDKTYGGTEYDFINAQVQLSDGSYATAGATRSVDGDVANQPRAGFDYWAAKMDNSGNKVWSKTYGSNFDEYATGVAPTSDGGLMLIGYIFDNFKHYATAMKLDGSGNKAWDKRISPSDDAQPLSIAATTDGNFLIAGYQKGERGDRDGWIAKISRDGNVIWTRSYGGGSEDQLTAIAAMPDGSFVLSGFSKSNGGDLAGNKGNFDGWLLKVDASGNRQWSQYYGGTDEDYLKNLTIVDGSIVASGYTKSTGGDIPGNRGGNEAWIMKVDGAGTRQWVKTFGGLNEEYITGVIKTNDGGFVFAGHSNSTTWDVSRRDNDFGCWIVKVDASGNKTATSTYGNRNDEFITTLIPTNDGGFLIGGYQDIPGRGYDGLLVKVGSL